MRKIKRVLQISLVLSLLLPSGISAQTLGNPFSLKKNTWSIGFGGEVAKYNLEEHEYSSARGIFKIDFALLEHIDAAVYLGTANLRILYPADRRLETLRSDLQFAYGASVKMRFWDPLYPKHRFFVEGGTFLTRAFGSTQSTSQTDPEEFLMQFNWREYWGTLGTIFMTHQLDVYAGFQGRVIHLDEVRFRTQYRSGIKEYIIAGIDLKLPDRLVINLQVRALNSTTFSIGISQFDFLKKNGRNR